MTDLDPHIYVIIRLDGGYLNAFATETDPAIAAITGETARIYPLCSIAKKALEDSLERCAQFTTLLYACAGDLQRALGHNPAPAAVVVYTGDVTLH